MPRTRKDVLFAMCDKIGGEKGLTLRSKFAQAIAEGRLGQRCNEELTEEEFAAALQAAEKSFEVMREWSKLPPVETWDRRN